MHAHAALTFQLTPPAMSPRADLDIFLGDPRKTFRTFHRILKTTFAQPLRWHRFLRVNWWYLKIPMSGI